MTGPTAVVGHSYGGAVITNAASGMASVHYVTAVATRMRARSVTIATGETTFVACSRSIFVAPRDFHR